MNFSAWAVPSRFAGSAARFRVAPAWVAVWLGFVALLLATQEAGACTRPVRAEALTHQLVLAINAERRRAGLRPLAKHPGVEAAAWVIACDNATHDQLSHIGSDGSNLYDRLRASLRRPFRTANENLAQANAHPRLIVRLWMASPEHRANMLAPTTRSIGTAVAQSASGRLYWAMVSVAWR